MTSHVSVLFSPVLMFSLLSQRSFNNSFSISESLEKEVNVEFKSKYSEANIHICKYYYKIEGMVDKIQGIIIE